MFLARNRERYIRRNYGNVCRHCGSYSSRVYQARGACVRPDTAFRVSIVFVFFEVAPHFKVVVGVVDKNEGGIYRSARQPVARANSVEVRTWPANRYK